MLEGEPSRRAARPSSATCSAGCRPRTSRPTRRRPSRDLAAAAFEHLKAPRAPARPGSAPPRPRGRARRARAATSRSLEVVNDNMPFLLDSTLAETRRAGLRAAPRRPSDPRGRARRRTARFVRFVGEADRRRPARHVRRESLIHIHLDRIDDAGGARAPDRGPEARLCRRRPSRCATGPPCARASPTSIADLPANPPPLPPDEIDEAVAFLEWMAADNFTFLGVREYRFPAGDTAADPVDGTGPRPPARSRPCGCCGAARELVVMTPEIRAFLAKPQALIITKANVKSRVHRRAHLDYVGVKLFSRRRAARGRAAHRRPVHRERLHQHHRRGPLSAPQGREGRRPRRVRPGELCGPRAAQRARELPARRAVPDRRRHALPLRPRHPEPVRAAAHPGARPASTSSTASSRCSSSSRRTATTPGPPPRRRVPGRRSTRAASRRPIRPIRKARSRAPITSSAATRATTPDGRSRDARGGHRRDRAHLGRRPARRARRDDRRARAPARSRRAMPTPSAPPIARPSAPRRRSATSTSCEQLSEARPRAVDLYRREGDADDARQPEGLLARRARCRSRSACRCSRISASASSTSGPIASRRPGAGEAERVWLHDMTLERAVGGADRHRGDRGPDRGGAAGAVPRPRRIGRASTASCSKPASAGATSRCCGRSAATCARSRIAYAPGLPRRDAGPPRRASPRSSSRCSTPASIRASASAARATAEARSAREIEDALRRRSPASTTTASCAASSTSSRRRCAPTSSRSSRTACRARRSRSSSNARRSTACRCRRPLYEIFVYSPRVEGVHLRFGKVARGGLRWSDRPQDFRTEVLGLVKAQQVKNAVIVPVGAKGGFVPKQLPPAERPAGLARGRHRELPHLRPHPARSSPTIIDGDRVVPPADTVRHDGDDPYLVVAADKGTATFSDIANALSIEKGHWLGDAFASGGSQGYDHKKMGITARGAWEAVKRHFREMDIDIQTRARHRRRRRRHVGRRVRQRHAAVARDQARRRLRPPRHLPRSRPRSGGARSPSASACSTCRARAGRTTTRALISKGGGVFSRSAKCDPALAAKSRPLLGLDKAEATPRRGHERDPQGAGRPALVRRHRHLCPRRRRRPTSRSATAPTTRSASPARESARQGDRRGRQSRRDPARPHRGRARGRAPQHRRDRQFGRRQHLRRRGQHQDRARRARARRPPRPRRRATRSSPR